MIVINENSTYQLINTLNTKYQGNYQILEKWIEDDEGLIIAKGWRTCGIYWNKSTAFEDFKKLSKGVI